MFSFGQKPAATPTTSLFGQQQQQPAQQTPLFGQQQSQQPAQQTSLFGQTQPTQQTSLFGQQQQQQPAQPTQSLFGQPAQQTSLFGQQQQPTQQQTQPTQGLSLFGQQQQPTQSASTLQFGGGTGIGQQQQQQQQPSLFGGTTAQQQTPFGQTTQQSLFGQSSIQQQQQQQQQVAQQPTDPTASQIDEVVAAFDNNDVRCKFRHPFYNVVSEQDVQRFIRPAGLPDGLWDAALKSNPNPKCMVPVFANGFEDLNKRCQHQTNQANMHKMKLKELESELEKVQQKHQVEATARLLKLQRSHLQLGQKVLRIMKTVQLLRSRGHTTLFPGEESLHSRLDALLKHVKRPEFQGRLSELQANAVMQGSLYSQKQAIAGSEQQQLVDEQTLQEMTRVIKEMQGGLLQLSELINRDLEGAEKLQKEIMPL